MQYCYTQLYLQKMTILVDGKKRAGIIERELQKEFNGLFVIPSLHVIYLGHDPVIENYLKYKKRYAERIGVDFKLHRFPSTLSLEAFKEAVTNICSLHEPLIIQLPLPPRFQRQEILDLVPPEVDVDVLSSQGREDFFSGTSPFVPPVTASIVDIITSHHIDLSQKIIIIGNGLLVGKPTAAWLKQQGYDYSIITYDTPQEERTTLLKEADIIISGVGKPQLVTPQEVKEGVVIIDAGTSESDTSVRGDVDPQVKEKSSLFTPVPGGVGPLTIAMLYRNVLAFYHND